MINITKSSMIKKKERIKEIWKIEKSQKIAEKKKLCKLKKFEKSGKKTKVPLNNYFIGTSIAIQSISDVNKQYYFN